MNDFRDRIRQSRAQPPGHAASEDRRRRLYSSALEQTEQLLDAAAAIGPAARPLPLFYALSQASKAIAAAFAEEDVTALPRAHGVTLEIDRDILRSQVIAQGDGWFQFISRLLGSDMLDSPVELGALWASLPELGGDPALEQPAWPRPLYVWPAWLDPDGSLAVALVRALPLTTVVFPDDVQTVEGIARALRPYPTARAAVADIRAVPGLSSIPREQTPRGLGISITWAGAPQTIQERDAIIDAVAPEYRQERWIIPGVGPRHSTCLKPLTSWWALLFGFSMLARYHPTEWVSALDVDASTVAVQLERALREGLSAVPQLVAEALYQRRL